MKTKVKISKFQDLIVIEENNMKNAVVSARDVYKILGIKKSFEKWFFGHVEDMNLNEGIDFFKLEEKKKDNKKGKSKVDYIISIDTAKYFCMISDGNKAHKIREFYIELEKRWIKFSNAQDDAEKMRYYVDFLTFRFTGAESI